MKKGDERIWANQNRIGGGKSISYQSYEDDKLENANQIEAENEWKILENAYQLEEDERVENANQLEERGGGVEDGRQVDL